MNYVFLKLLQFLHIILSAFFLFCSLKFHIDLHLVFFNFFLRSMLLLQFILPPSFGKAVHTFSASLILPIFLLFSFLVTYLFVLSFPFLEATPLVSLSFLSLSAALSPVLFCVPFSTPSKPFYSIVPFHAATQVCVYPSSFFSFCSFLV